MDLLAIGDQGVPGKRIVVLPACQLTDASNGAVDGLQAGAVALAPDHPLMKGGGDFAAMLDQTCRRHRTATEYCRSIAIALVDANGHYHLSLLAGFANGVK